MASSDSVLPPRPPPGAPLRDVAAYMAASNRHHARKDKLMLPDRPLEARELAPAIARDNDARARREQSEAARSEIRLACGLLTEEIARNRGAYPELGEFFETFGLFVGGVREFLDAEGSGPKSDALAAMRAAIASLESRTRGVR